MMQIQESNNQENNSRVTRHLRQNWRHMSHMAASVPISTLYMMLGNKLMSEVASGNQQNLPEEYLQTLLVMAAAMKLSDLTINLTARLACLARIGFNAESFNLTSLFNLKLKDLAEIPLSTAYMMALHKIFMPNMAQHHMNMEGQMAMNHMDHHHHHMEESSLLLNYLTMTGIMGASMLASEATIKTGKATFDIAKRAATSIRNAVATNLGQNPHQILHE